MIRRQLSLEADMHRWLYEPDQVEEVRDAKAQARAHFGVFVRGKRIDDRYFMSRIEDKRQSGKDIFSHGVWAMATRFDAPPPQIRYFGLFATTDFFLVLTKQNRDVLEESPDRGHAEIDKARTIWNELFPGRVPVLSNNLHEYISRNVEKRDARW
jgi:hypothetical protein